MGLKNKTKSKTQFFFSWKACKEKFIGGIKKYEDKNKIVTKSKYKNNNITLENKKNPSMEQY